MLSKKSVKYRRKIHNIADFFLKKNGLWVLTVFYQRSIAPLVLKMSKKKKTRKKMGEERKEMEEKKQGVREINGGDGVCEIWMV